MVEVTQLVLLTVDIDNIIKGERREYFFYLVYRSDPVVLSLVLTSILVYCAGVEAFNWVPVRPLEYGYNNNPSRN